MHFCLPCFIIGCGGRANEKILKNSKKYGPLSGGLLGMVPQCGFSVLATNLYSSRIITIGTLIAVYLSTSDEMLPILLSGGMSFINAITIIFYLQLFLK